MSATPSAARSPQQPRATGVPASDTTTDASRQKSSERPRRRQPEPVHPARTPTCRGSAARRAASRALAAALIAADSRFAGASSRRDDDNDDDNDD